VAAAARRALVAGLLVLGGTLYAAFGPSFCPAALFFGVPCPGCGLTRATLAMLRGDLGAALHFHPLSPLLVPLFFAALAKVLVDYVRGPGRALPPPRWWTGRAATVAFSALLVLVVGVWVARFGGALGGPVPVESLAHLKAQLVAARGGLTERGQGAFHNRSP